MRILVTIANYGFRNKIFIDKLIENYISMPCNTDIVVLSNEPKEFSKKVKVVVGLPTKDPWSLPFAHKIIFEDNKNIYDLFLYSEDDILITWKNICAFLDVTAILPGNDCAGFMRYEVDDYNNISYPDFLGPYHWIADSVKKINNEIIARFSNFHSGCYILTKKQLDKAIKSGGFSVKPHKGKYDLLCSAATDPYTQCGLTKVICISKIADFLVHHMSNRYSQEFGISEDDFNRQIKRMLNSNGNISEKELIVPIKHLDTYIYDKMYYPQRDNNLIECLSKNDKDILSIGCGAGVNEGVLVENQFTVTAIPIDSIIGEIAKIKNINVLEPDIYDSLRKISDRVYDCIIMDDILHHFENPKLIFRIVLKYLKKGGKIIVVTPNFYSLRNLRRSFPYPIIRRFSYKKNKITPLNVRIIENELIKAGLNKISIKHPIEEMKKVKLPEIFGLKRKLLCDNIYIVGQ